MRKISKIRSVVASLGQCQKILKLKGLSLKKSRHVSKMCRGFKGSKSPLNIQF